MCSIHNYYMYKHKIVAVCLHVGLLVYFVLCRYYSRSGICIYMYMFLNER